MILMRRRNPIKRKNCHSLLIWLMENLLPYQIVAFCHSVSLGLGFFGTSQWFREMVRFSKTPLKINTYYFTKSTLHCQSSKAGFLILIFVDRFCDFWTLQKVHVSLTKHIICFDFLKNENIQNKWCDWSKTTTYTFFDSQNSQNL